MVVRVEIDPGPATQPDAELIRYFDVKYDAVFNKLTYERDSNIFSYYSAMFLL